MARLSVYLPPPCAISRWTSPRSPPLSWGSRHRALSLRPWAKISLV
uniref:Uncharacterized protein n=1 Tax=Anguilla anguilla TaxID=7936 RepID=A0A0E9SRD8_ANGAN